MSDMPKEKKKVLYIITKSNFGGAQRYVYDLACNLNPSEYEPIVAFGTAGEAHTDADTLEAKLGEKNIRTIFIKNFCRDISIKNEILVFFELLRIVRHEKPDALHVTSSKAGGIGAVVGRLTRTKRIIFTSHGLAYDESWRPFWQRTLIKLATWFTIFFSHQTIQITQDTCARANALPFLKKKNTLIHNGRSTPVFLSREDARRTLSNDSHEKKEVWIGITAELTKNKNLDALVRALGILHRKDYLPHLYVCGEGEERNTLTALAEKENVSEYIHLVGYIENAAKYLSAFDIYTLPSLKEGLPYAIMEAGFASLPVVASNIPGITDLITDKETGLLTETDPESIAQGLETFIKNPDMRKEYGMALNNHIHSQFSVKRMVEKTSELYQ